MIRSIATAVSRAPAWLLALLMSGAPLMAPRAAGSQQVRALPVEGESMRLDGRLTESLWSRAEPASGFVQRDPDEGKAATESTTVWITYDDGAIYVGARMYDSKPDSIVSRLGRRDDYTGADRFTFYVDSYHDRRSGFWFAVDVAGTLSDGTLYNDDWDSNSWDGVWEGRAARDSLAAFMR